ncbi:MAG TPA: dihydrolipoamide acetyltransferase family protein [Burkholderiaceae bacterium]|nr:dihydrolipoamide acetyltransferase family protein [Burkholderiaceae bacterium]
MGIHVIKMPDIGEGIAEVELVEWHVKPGDTVKEDQVLADVMTDKATVQIPSPVVGKVLALGGEIGQVMAVGTELIRIEVEGAGNVRAAEVKTAAGPTASAPAQSGASAPTPRAPAPASEAARAAALAAGARAAPRTSAGLAPTENLAAVGPDEAVAADATVAPTVIAAGAAPAQNETMRAKPRATQTGAPAAVLPFARKPGDKPIASPAVRRRAWELGVELHFVHGTGTAGRITHDDLDAYVSRAGAPQAASASGAAYQERHDEQAQPVIGLRRKIAQRMQDAKRRIPHFTYVEEVDVTELEALRAQLNAKWSATRGRLTLLPFLIRAVVIAVRDFPQINARFDDEKGIVMRHGAVHVGVATQTEGGLMVPVLQHAEARDLWASAAEVARLAEAARTGKATRAELSGSTITITSLGPLGGIVTTPVINPPEVAIIGVNRIVERPMIRAGAVVPRQMMNLSSAFDHRVVDGHDAAQFVQALRALLECPATLFVE